MAAQLIYIKPLYNFSLSTARLIVNNKLCFSLEGLPFNALQEQRKTNLFFATDAAAFFILFTNFKKLLANYSFFSSFYGFNWFRFVLYSGLGYKRRLYRRYKVMFAYIGHRDWILYKFSPIGGVLPARRRNYTFFAKAKGTFLKDYNFFASLSKRPPLYKMKGFLDSRVRGRFLFVRRIRIRGAHTKLSKKQKLL